MDPDTPQGRRLGQKIFDIFEMSYSYVFDDKQVAHLWRVAGIQRVYAEDLYDELIRLRKTKQLVISLEAHNAEEAALSVAPSLPSKALHGRRSKRAINNLHRL